MNNNPDTKDKSGNNDFSDIPAEELPPVESCIMLSEMDQDNYVKPVRMYYESDTKQTSASSLAVLFGFILTCLFAGVILTLWRAFNPYGFFYFSLYKAPLGNLAFGLHTSDYLYGCGAGHNGSDLCDSTALKAAVHPFVCGCSGAGNLFAEGI